MTHVQTMVNVIMPQALRNIIPQIGNNFIINIKDTSVMFVIGFVEFFATHRNIVGVNLLYFPSAVIEMAGYLMLTLAALLVLIHSGEGLRLYALLGLLLGAVLWETGIRCIFRWIGKRLKKSFPSGRNMQNHSE